jgi:hypothetical protein
MVTYFTGKTNKHFKEICRIAFDLGLELEDVYYFTYCLDDIQSFWPSLIYSNSFSVLFLVGLKISILMPSLGSMKDCIIKDITSSQIDI